MESKKSTTSQKKGQRLNKGSIGEKLWNGRGTGGIPGGQKTPSAGYVPSNFRGTKHSRGSSKKGQTFLKVRNIE